MAFVGGDSFGSHDKVPFRGSVPFTRVFGTQIWGPMPTTSLMLDNDDALALETGTQSSRNGLIG